MTDEERLEQIRQLNEEIVTARQMFNYTSHFIGEPVGRILARLESALADLKHGMRTAAQECPRRLSND